VIRGLLQGTWNLGHRRRYRELEERTERLEYWVRVHAPFIDSSAVASPYDDPEYDPLGERELKRSGMRFHGFLAQRRKKT